jgi:hypothetical protein
MCHGLEFITPEQLEEATSHLDCLTIGSDYLFDAEAQW